MEPRTVPPTSTSPLIRPGEAGWLLAGAPWQRLAVLGDSVATGVPAMSQLAGAFASAGFLAVRYDNRGSGQSGGRTEAAALADYAEDTRAVMKWLTSRKDVDPRRIAFVGHGVGAWIALFAASREKRVGGVAILGAKRRAPENCGCRQRLFNSTCVVERGPRKAKPDICRAVFEIAVLRMHCEGVEKLGRAADGDGRSPQVLPGIVRAYQHRLCDVAALCTHAAENRIRLSRVGAPLPQDHASDLDRRPGKRLEEHLFG